MAAYNIRQHFQYLSAALLDLETIIQELSEHVETSLEILDHQGTIPEGGDDDEEPESELICDKKGLD